VSIAGSSRVAESATRLSRTGAIFSCSVPGSPSRFVVPPEVLSFLPASPVQQGIPTGGIVVAETEPVVKFPASQLEYGQLTYTSGVTKNVTFR